MATARGHLFTLSTRNVRGWAARFYARDREAQRRIRDVVRRNGEALFEEVYFAAPEETGRTKRLLRDDYGADGLSYEVGWREEDFAAEDQPLYMIYYIFGTRFRPGKDFFFPLKERQDRLFRDELRTDLRAALRRRAA